MGRVEQPASWHVGVRHTAGWGAVVTAGGLEEADLVWAGAGQADSTPAEFVGGADGGGRAGGDAAAEGSTASHGQELGFCWVDERSLLVSRCFCRLPWLLYTHLPGRQPITEIFPPCFSL